MTIGHGVGDGKPNDAAQNYISAEDSTPIECVLWSNRPPMNFRYGISCIGAQSLKFKRYFELVKHFYVGPKKSEIRKIDGHFISNSLI